MTTTEHADEPQWADSARLEWLLHVLSGRALREINVIPSTGGLEFGRIAIDAAIASLADRRSGGAS